MLSENKFDELINTKIFLANLKEITHAMIYMLIKNLKKEK